MQDGRIRMDVSAGEYQIGHQGSAHHIAREARGAICGRVRKALYNPRVPKSDRRR